MTDKSKASGPAKAGHYRDRVPGPAKAGHYRDQRRKLVVRDAGPEDRQRLFDWANDPVTRAQSFNTEPISWTGHCGWFDRVLQNPNQILLIVCIGAEAIGQARFDWVSDRESEVSISIGSVWRGRGLAAPAIRVATGEACARGRDRLHAYVKHGNEPSRRAFLRAGYIEQGETRRYGHDVIHLMTSRESVTARRR